MSGTRFLVGLIGANIQRSLSPALHEDAFAAAGLVGYYHLIDLNRLGDAADLGAILGALRLLGWTGVNVTHPCKESAVPLLDALAPEAAEIGAVNTVVFGADGRATGHNTDRPGFRQAFTATLGAEAVRGRAALVVGVGGAGRAVCHALCDLGAATILVYDTDRGRASAVAASLPAAEAVADPREAARRAAGVVNASPVGMVGYPGQPLALDRLRPDAWVADVVYTPLETRLIAEARRRGCRVMTGRGMCVHQAAEAFRLFTGRTPDVDRMGRLFDRLCSERDAGLAAAG